MTVDAGFAMRAVDKALAALTGRKKARPLTPVNFDGTDCLTVKQLAAANGRSDLVAAAWAVEHKADIRSELFRSAAGYLREQKTLTPGPPSNSDGICIAFTFDDDARMQLAQEGGEPWQDLHITLGYFGSISNTLTKASFAALCMRIATEFEPFDVALNGIARFSGDGDGKDPFVVNADSTVLPTAYAAMQDHCRALNIAYTPTHGYTPHMTLGYLDRTAPVPLHRWAPVTVKVTAIELWYGKQRYPFALGHDYRDAIKNVDHAYPQSSPQGVKAFVRTAAGSRKYKLPIGAHIPGTPYNDEERAVLAAAATLAEKPAADEPAGETRPRKTWPPFEEIDYSGEGNSARRRAQEDFQDKTRDKYTAYTRTPPRDSGDFDGMTHFEMLRCYQEWALQYAKGSKSAAKRKQGDYIRDYAGSGYDDMNAWLRGRNVDYLDDDDIAELDMQAKGMDRVMDARPAPTNMVVHRLTESRVMGDLKPGTEFIDRAYTSTTVGEPYLEAVSTELYDADSQSLVSMEIRVPKGTPGTYVTAFQSVRHPSDLREQEFLLKRGTRFRVVDKHPAGTNGRKHAHLVLEVVP